MRRTHVRRQRGVAILIVVAILTIISIVAVSFVYFGSGVFGTASAITGEVLARGGDVDVWIPDSLAARIGTSSVAEVPPRGSYPGTRFVATPLSEAAPMFGWIEDGRTGTFTFLAPGDPPADAVYVEAEDIPGGIDLVMQAADRLDRACAASCPPRTACDCAAAVRALDDYAREPGAGSRVLFGAGALHPAALGVLVIER